MENKFLDTREELQKALKKLTQVEHEVQTTKSNAQVQQEEIMKKAGTFGMLHCVVVVWNSIYYGIHEKFKNQLFVCFWWVSDSRL